MAVIMQITVPTLQCNNVGNTLVFTRLDCTVP